MARARPLRWMVWRPPRSPDHPANLLGSLLSLRLHHDVRGRLALHRSAHGKSGPPLGGSASGITGRWVRSTGNLLGSISASSAGFAGSGVCIVYTPHEPSNKTLGKSRKWCFCSGLGEKRREFEVGARYYFVLGQWGTKVFRGGEHAQRFLGRLKTHLFDLYHHEHQ